MCYAEVAELLLRNEDIQKYAKTTTVKQRICVVD